MQSVPLGSYVRLDFSDDRLAELQAGWQRECDEKAREMPFLQSIVERLHSTNLMLAKHGFPEISSTNKCRMLFAHGRSNYTPWSYVDLPTPETPLIPENTFPIQSWIDRYDGEFPVLIIESCNTGKPDYFTLTSQRSVIIYPNGITDGLDRVLRRAYYRGAGQLARELVVAAPR